MNTIHGRIRSTLAGLLRRLAAACRAAEIRRETAHLSEHLLRDIGLWNGRR